jgi:hypothetical protein
MKQRRMAFLVLRASEFAENPALTISDSHAMRRTQLHKTQTTA